VWTAAKSPCPSATKRRKPKYCSCIRRREEQVTSEPCQQPSPLLCEHRSMLASIALTPSWQVEKSIARGRSGFSIIWGPVNLSGPRVLRLDLGHPEKETTTTMAIEIDRIGSSDSSELEHDYANSQIEGLFMFAVRHADRPDPEWEGLQRSTYGVVGQLHIVCSTSSTASRLCRSYGVCKRSEGGLECVSSAECTGDRD
jgi:hypothetical protein